MMHRKHCTLLLFSALTASETSAALASSVSSVVVQKADFDEVLIETVPLPPLSAQETRKHLPCLNTTQRLCMIMIICACLRGRNSGGDGGIGEWGNGGMGGGGGGVCLGFPLHPSSPQLQQRATGCCEP